VPPKPNRWIYLRAPVLYDEEKTWTVQTFRGLIHLPKKIVRQNRTINAFEIPEWLILKEGLTNTLTTGRERLLICGGRNFADESLMHSVLDFRRKPELVIHGGASGADTLANEWAEFWGYPIVEFPADRVRFGKRAGPLRNSQMLRDGKPTLVIAFPGGFGTLDMIGQALTAGVPILHVNPASSPSP
jgi:hypothetical protein